MMHQFLLLKRFFEKVGMNGVNENQLAICQTDCISCGHVFFLSLESRRFEESY